jgi:hypothetical protein
VCRQPLIMLALRHGRIGSISRLHRGESTA